jgi:hypothetical protein
MVRVCTIALHRREPVIDSGDSLIPVPLNHPGSHNPDVAPHQHSLVKCAYRQLNNFAVMVNGIGSDIVTMSASNARGAGIIEERCSP